MPLNIVEVQNYDETVPLLLTTDAVLGATAVDNIGTANGPMQALANRTKYLKNKSGLYTRNSTQRVITATAQTIENDDAGKHIIVDISSGNASVLLDGTSAIDDFAVFKIKVFCPQGKTVTLQPNGAETIRFDDGQRTAFYMMNNEWANIMRLDGSWIVLDCSPNIYEVGFCLDGYATDNNVIQRNGSSLVRADYARLWDWVQRKIVSGQGLLAEATWLASVVIYGETVYPYKGCFSTGNTTTTFRVPDDRGMSTRYLDQGRNVDLLRTWNFVGGYEHDYVKNHKHTTDLNPNSNNTSGLGKVGVGGESAEGTLPLYTSSNPINSAGTAIGQAEGTVKNTAKLPLIRV